ncbi:hypothetical protein ACIQ6R_24200 [Streptomyces sp. NPDC096048]|uniref:hypothetical protein n=1 Tax=Streptomyces sp. NPDC096048 TaxID=3366072 RepID=UPI0038147B06
MNVPVGLVSLLLVAAARAARDPHGRGVAGHRLPGGPGPGLRSGSPAPGPVLGRRGARLGRAARLGTPAGRGGPARGLRPRGVGRHPSDHPVRTVPQPHLHVDDHDGVPGVAGGSAAERPAAAQALRRRRFPFSGQVHMTWLQLPWQHARRTRRKRTQFGSRE